MYLSAYSGGKKAVPKKAPFASRQKVWAMLDAAHVLHGGPSQAFEDDSPGDAPSPPANALEAAHAVVTLAALGGQAGSDHKRPMDQASGYVYIRTYLFSSACHL